MSMSLFNSFSRDNLELTIHKFGNSLVYLELLNLEFYQNIQNYSHYVDYFMILQNKKNL